MGKRRSNTRELLKPDVRYRNFVAGKFINCLMYGGKKTTAQACFYGALEILGKRFPDQEPLEVFLTAVNNVKPMVEVRSRRVGGATYQVPKEVSPRRRQSLAIRWLLVATRKKKGKPMSVRLANELANAYRKEGEAITTRENVHKMAEANKAFAHFGSRL